MHYYNESYNKFHNQYRVMSNDDLKINDKIISIIINHIERYTQSHMRTFIVFIGLKYPLECLCSETNEDIQVFMDRFKKHLAYKELDPHYVWVREQKTSENQHYHCMLLLNGRNIRNHYGIAHEAERIWNSIVGYHGEGFVHYRQESFMLDKGSEKYMQDKEFVIYYASYLAKENTKYTLTPLRHRNVGYSHI
ncbi:inovirus Gp2 family protein [Desulfovibrio sp. OttesenSCG-928-C14]|nr:inovirus Gp2 family protein [Desulfovibrio sp. OttesenSCG-928-C14]